MIVVVMGVAGSGKSTVGQLLAEALGGTFVEGDRFHSKENVAKMARGEALTEDDRRPWYEELSRQLGQWSSGRQEVVLACSALRRAHRDGLRRAGSDVRFLFLDGDRGVIHSRLEARSGHFFGADLLASQLADLEAPEPDEGVLAADVAEPAEVIARRAARVLTR